MQQTGQAFLYIIATRGKNVRTDYSSEMYSVSGRCLFRRTGLIEGVMR